MDSHLVSVEVGVERGTYERVEFYRSALDKYGFESLNSETVKGRRAVKKNGSVLDNRFESVPDGSFGSFDHFLRGFYILDYSEFGKSLHYERLEKFESHFFRKTALIYLQFGSDDDNGTSGVVDTFTEKVLSETSLLAFENFGKRFERSV